VTVLECWRTEGRSHSWCRRNQQRWTGCRSKKGSFFLQILLNIQISLNKYSRTRLLRHRFMRYPLYNVRCSVVPINSYPSLLTITLYSSVKTTQNIQSPSWCYNRVRFHVLHNRNTSCLSLALILLTWKIWRVRNNTNKWQMAFNSAYVRVSAVCQCNTTISSGT